jgi:hypothetical protein
VGIAGALRLPSGKLRVAQDDSSKNRQRQGQMRGALHCGGRCAAFGRDDGGLRLDEEAVVRYRKRCPTHRIRQRRDGWGTRHCGMTNKNRQQRNAGVPPLRRQSTPPPVGMTESDRALLSLLAVVG